MKIKFKNFCGIFATLFVTTTMVLLASCSQDDDNYDSDMYTLAEMGTRLGGGDPGNGGYDPNPPKPYFGNPVQAGVDTVTFDMEMHEMQVVVSWSNGYTGASAPVSMIAITPCYWDTLSYIPYPENQNHHILTYIRSTGQWEGPNNMMRIRVDYVKDSITYIRNHNDTEDSAIYFPPYITHSVYEYIPTCVPDPSLQPL